MTEISACSIENKLLTDDSTTSAIIEIEELKANTPVVSVVAPYPPRLNSKLILQNMEEVLHTVKKQHKEKHRRKKELKKLAMMEAAAVQSNEDEDAAVDKVQSKSKNDEGSSAVTEKRHKHRDKEKSHRHSSSSSKKKPLQEKHAVENGKIQNESPIKSGTILQHFQRTPSKASQVSVDTNDDENADKMTATAKAAKVANAFEVMMNARNKTIGSNTPGKDSPSPVVDKEESAINVKRKLKLQEWAEQRGGAKRKLDEEARALYVEEQLEQRAKRFKQMLVNGASPKSTAKQSSKTTEKTKKSETPKENKSKERSTKRPKRKAKRLDSVDSVDSVEVNAVSSPPTVDVETADFLSKLNSPTKKRDSLLGYFPKKESPKELVGKTLQKSQTLEESAAADKKDKESKSECEKNETPKRRGRPPKLLKKSTPAVELPQKVEVATMQETEAVIDTPTARPRRSCVGKARYDYDAEESPTKVTKENSQLKSSEKEQQQQQRAAAKSEKISKDVEDIIILDDSMGAVSNTTTPQNTPKKLAPLFVRSVPKPSPDPEKLKAKKAFLLSGVPEKLRMEQEKQKQYDQNYEEAIELFPKVAHIKQLSEIELQFESKSHKLSYKLQAEDCDFTLPSVYAVRSTGKGKSKKSQSNIGHLSDCKASDFQIQSKNTNIFHLDQALLSTLANKRAIIKNWKNDFDRFPTYKCYNQMREKYRYFSAIDSAQDTEQVSESFVFTRRTRRSLEAQQQQQKKNNEDNEEEYKPPATAPNGELLFNEKYKPLLLEQVLVNLNPVTQLKEFLSNWTNGNNGAGSARNSQNLDDTLDFNDSSTSNQGPSCNAVVLLGPVSSGKTNAVFALANEMNFNVLEINAGMKRTGKKLMQELQEATQSHQIRKDSAGTASSNKNNLLKMSLNGLKSKVKKQNSSTSLTTPEDSNSSSDLAQTDRKCLILIEDADITFEQTDAGFVDAIYSLAASSKRPVIIVATNKNCSHLQRLISQNTIYFSAPNALNISRFLAVLSLMENCPVSLDDLISLFLYNKKDLRKTLLELQFFIQSGGDRQRQDLKQNNPKETRPELPTYFASPRKRQFSVEQDHQQQSSATTSLDDNNGCAVQKSTTSSLAPCSSDLVYIHRTLFEFYTVGQNINWRIPYPVDFHLFNINLSEIFQVSKNLKLPATNDNNQKDQQSNEKVTKRKSRSPKKHWLNTATKSNVTTSLDHLCSFYENLSTAALINKQENDLYKITKNKEQKPQLNDCLNVNLKEEISHTLLEKAIELDLNANTCPYNLFDAHKESSSIYEEMGSMQMRTLRSRNLDYEPCLRSICRSEKIRSSLERRSTRFYHYLRTFAVNISSFSTAQYDEACQIFQNFNEDNTDNDLMQHQQTQ